MPDASEKGLEWVSNAPELANYIQVDRNITASGNINLTIEAMQPGKFYLKLANVYKQEFPGFDDYTGDDVVNVKVTVWPEDLIPLDNVKMKRFTMRLSDPPLML